MMRATLLSQIASSSSSTSHCTGPPAQAARQIFREGQHQHATYQSRTIHRRHYITGTTPQQSDESAASTSSSNNGDKHDLQNLYNSNKEKGNSRSISTASFRGRLQRLTERLKWDAPPADAERVVVRPRRMQRNRAKRDSAREPRVFSKRTDSPTSDVGGMSAKEVAYFSEAMDMRSRILQNSTKGANRPQPSVHSSTVLEDSPFLTMIRSLGLSNGAADERVEQEQKEHEEVSSKNEATDAMERDPPPHLRSSDEESKKALSDRWMRRTELIKGPAIDKHRRVRPAAEDTTQYSDASSYLPIDRLNAYLTDRETWWHEEGKWMTSTGGKLHAEQVTVDRVEPLREMQVPQLTHGLDRVLFNPGVHWLRDVRSGIYNFDPSIRNIYDVDLFDYSALPPYRTSSKDPELAQLVQRLKKRYSGSTSSMTALLSHIYFLISAWKQPNLTGYSAGFSTLAKDFSYGAKLPASIFLRRFEETLEDGSTGVRYAIDADKVVDNKDDDDNYVLKQLGKSVEKLLTSSPEEYQKYLRVNSHVLSKEEREKDEAYHYASMGKILMRSQLDCQDDRLPRRTFDLKTRAVVAVRQDRANWVESSGYLIRQLTGVFESFEREMWDMTRAALLKYYFQAKIGNMDGILVAYHSTATMFGFQYLPCEDIAMRLFSSVEMGEQAFKLSVAMLERILDVVTDLNPDHTLRLTMDTESGVNPKMTIFLQNHPEEGEAAAAANSTGEEGRESDETAEPDQKLLQLDVQVDRYLSDALVRGPVDFSMPDGHAVNSNKEDEISRRARLDLPAVQWSIEYSITPRSDLSQPTTRENLKKIRLRQENVSTLVLPNLGALREREREREAELAKNETALQKYLEERKSGLVMASQVVKVAADDGDVQAARADVQEQEAQRSAGRTVAEGTDPKQQPNQPTPTTATWKKQTASIARLRELAKLGKQDKDRDALTDQLEMYERRGD